MSTAPNIHQSGTGQMSAHRPGDIILGRHLPNATPEERETARESLYRFARLLMRVHERLALDNPQQPIRASDELALESDSLPPTV
jgi:hypothetical protein